jgi:5-formyltetrahydrofolate cyclo-ligase
VIYDQWICDSLWELIRENEFEKVHCYLPMSTEINIFPLIDEMLAANMTVICPKTFPKRRLQNLVLKSANQVEEGVHGTSHPANSEEFLGEYDLIIVPGLAFDTANFRLGYGGGYYDSFLADNPETLKVGIFYPFQKVIHIPLEPHDVQLDKIISQE